MAFCSPAIRSGRAFLRRFYDAMAGVNKSYHRVRISGAVRLDLGIWQIFLEQFNGVTYIPPDSWLDSSTIQLYTDSAGSPELGCGCFLNGEWSFFQWPEQWHSEQIMKDITFLETVPVVLALCLRGNQLQFMKVLLRIDNEALVTLINKQTSKSKRLMQLVREFVLIVVVFGIIVRSLHITTHSNSVADSFSRKQWRRFRELVPDACQEPN